MSGGSMPLYRALYPATPTVETPTMVSGTWVNVTLTDVTKKSLVILYVEENGLTAGGVFARPQGDTNLLANVDSNVFSANGQYFNSSRHGFLITVTDNSGNIDMLANGNGTVKVKVYAILPLMAA